MLAGSPLNSTESLFLAHGFGIGALHDLVRDGLATAETRTVRAGAAGHSPSERRGTRLPIDGGFRYHQLSVRQTALRGGFMVTVEGLRLRFSMST
jgi:hypothetical protein